MSTVQIHIWELSEKTDNVNTDDLILIHDNISLKKTNISKLFEYLRQEHKIESTIAYFENKLKSINDRYNILYSSLEIHLDDLETVVQLLEDKFNINKNNIRSIETSMNKLYKSIVSTSKSFDSMNNDNAILSETLHDFSTVIADLESQAINNSTSLSRVDSKLNDLQNSYTQLYDNTQSISDQIEKIKEIITTGNDNKKDELIQNI